MAKKTNNKATQEHTAHENRTPQAWPSRQQMVEPHESIVQMLKEVTQAKSEGTPLTTEQRLLDALFQPDVPDGPGKTDNRYQAINLLDFWKIAERSTSSVQTSTWVTLLSMGVIIRAESYQA